MTALMRIVEIIPSGHWPAAAADERVTLTFDERYRRRLSFTTPLGTRFLLNLPRARVLNAGDGLRLDDGRVVGVEAAAEDLVEVTAESQALLVRLAWHIGNRHLPAQLEAERILLREDAVIVRMLQGLGATVRPLRAAFTPENGAYHQHD